MGKVMINNIYKLPNTYGKNFNDGLLKFINNLKTTVISIFVDDMNINIKSQFVNDVGEELLTVMNTY